MLIMAVQKCTCNFGSGICHTHAVFIANKQLTVLIVLPVWRINFIIIMNTIISKLQEEARGLSTPTAYSRRHGEYFNTPKNKHKEREKETDRRNAPDICYFVSLVEKQTM